MKIKLTKTTTIKTIIKKIEDVLEVSDTLFHSAGLSEGILGLSLFYYYLYLYAKNEAYLDKVSYYLEESFSKLSNNDKIGACSELDLIELGKYLCFLNTQKMIDDDVTKKYLQQLDQPVRELLQKKIIEQDLDAIIGITAIGHYFLDALHIIDYQDEIKKLIQTIDDFSIASGNTSYWNFNLRDKHNPTVESGFFHGISGVIFFLAQVFDKGILTTVCSKLINKATDFLLQYQRSSGINLFPYDIKSGETLSYQSLVYGDIGIGYTIYQAGIFLKNKKHIDIGLNILQNAATYKDDDSIYCKDAEIIYGAAGLFALFSSLERRTSYKTFKEASNYWLNKTIQYSQNTSPWAGFETYINGFEEVVQLSFAHGICGIGISLLCHQMGFDHIGYLRFFNYK